MKENIAKPTAGYRDLPIDTLEDDTFEVSRYIEALGTFILYCDTPMTIAIQGDWGSGKTSMMNLVRARIASDIVDVWFNTWQFSQFDLQEGLAGALFKNLLDVLGCSEETHNRVLSVFKGVAKTAMVIGLEKVVGEVIAGRLESSGDNDGNSQPGDLQNLKATFQEAIRAKQASSGKDRVVIFIDDLDRIQPEKAVEFLEVLKIFLDCEGCVFVLAVDYEVVTQGISQKFGDLVSKEKGRSFFDKIIQLPFKMPVAHYKVDAYIADMLRSMGIECDAAAQQGFVSLIVNSTGRNPRTIKRLFNAFQLINIISADLYDHNIKTKQILCGSLCMQLAFEPLYNYLTANASDLDEDTFRGIIEPGSEAAEKELLEILQMPDSKELQRMRDFCKVFVQTLQLDEDPNLSAAEFEKFKHILRYSTITAVGATQHEDTADSRDWERRYRNRNIIKAVNDHLRTEYPHEFSVYQIRKDRVGWTFEDACGWAIFPLKGNMNLKTHLDFILHAPKADSEVELKLFREGGKEEAFITAMKGLAGFESSGFIQEAEVFQKILLQSDEQDESALADIIFQALRPILNLLL
jgi:hypothetical protein